MHDLQCHSNRLKCASGEQVREQLKLDPAIECGNAHHIVIHFIAVILPVESIPIFECGVNRLAITSAWFVKAQAVMAVPLTNLQCTRV